MSKEKKPAKKRKPRTTSEKPWQRESWKGKVMTK